MYIQILQLFSFLTECLDDRAVCEGNFALLVQNLFSDKQMYSAVAIVLVTEKKIKGKEIHSVNLKAIALWRKKKSLNLWS